MANLKALIEEAVDSLSLEEKDLFIKRELARDMAKELRKEIREIEKGLERLAKA